MRPARDLLGQPALPRLPGAVEDNHGPVGKGIKQIVSDVARVHAISVVLAGRRIKRQLADYPPTAGGLSDSRHLVSLAAQVRRSRCPTAARWRRGRESPQVIGSIHQPRKCGRVHTRAA